MGCCFRILAGVRCRYEFAICALLICASTWVLGGSKAGGPAAHDVKIHIDRGVFYLADGAPVYARDLDGVLRPPQTPGSKRNVFDVASGTALLKSGAVTNLLREQFSAPYSKITDPQFSTEDGKVKIKGKLKQKVPVPFEMSGSLAVTPEGKLSIHSTSIQAAKVPVKGLMDVFGMNLKDVAGAAPEPGVRVLKDTLVLDPEQLSSRLQLAGKVTHVQVERDGIVLTFGPGRTKGTAARSQPSW